MSKSMRQFVFEGMELLPDALAPFVEKRLESALPAPWQLQAAEKLNLRPNSQGLITWDQASLLGAMDRFWAEAFKGALGKTERSWVNELADVRNKLAHNEQFTYDTAERALDTLRRLMDSISAEDTAERLTKMRDTILRTKFTELQRNEERKKTQRVEISVESHIMGLLSWREVVEPYHDVANGTAQLAEFAADLGKVHKGSAASEYRNPQEFFARTYLTEGLSQLLVNAAKRLTDTGGDSVVELQTNFGGGKTHSMLALYHMAGHASAQDLPGLDQLLSEREVTLPAKVNRAVLVGTARGPLDVLTIPNGPQIRTTWGELAWQLGGAEAFALIAENDAKGIAPGSNLLETLFRQCAPCLILIDEWVAYLRQIYKIDGLPSGSFDANLSFVQSLTEAVKASPGTLLVASLPASQIEVGGEGGQEALARLKQTFARVETSWRPASQEESYEIVRRRLFKTISGDKAHHKDNTVKQFARLYKDNASDFPPGSADEDYRRKMDRAYPIHPELFDQLYTGWGSLEKFQRTRGVLRLMAQVVHELWMGHDPAVMIMPGSVAIASERVGPELLHYLEGSWQSIISGDVDGFGSTPYKIDQGAPNLNRCFATRRIARAIFMGTAPTYQQKNKGLDDKQINLGVVQPGEQPALFDDALRRLTSQAKFMHADHGRYWYSMAASLNRLAADRADQLQDDDVMLMINVELKSYIHGLKDRGHFETVQVASTSSADIPDEKGIRAVILRVANPHNGREGSEAMAQARDILLHRGSAPRVYRNTLVFLAADARQLDNLKRITRSWMAWVHIVENTARLDLTQSDTLLAKKKLEETAKTLKTCLHETWCYLLYPEQEDARIEAQWSSVKITSLQEGLLVSASKMLVKNEKLLLELGPQRLDLDLQKYIWHGKPHLSLKDLWEHLNRFPYLPRLKSQDVLVKGVHLAISGMIPGPFAYAEGWDEKSQSYQGLVVEKASETVVVRIDDNSVIVAPESAEAHRPRPASAADRPGGETSSGDGVSPAGATIDKVTGATLQERKLTRFRGTVMIPAERPAGKFQQIIEAIVAQLTTLPGSEVSLKFEIDAEVPGGLDPAKVRTLMENANTLNFIDKKID